MTESFTAQDRDEDGWVLLQWTDGVFTGPPAVLDRIKALIESGEGVSLGSTLPQADAAVTPGWVALATARQVLELNPDEDTYVWDTDDVAFPDGVFGYPPGSVS